MRSRHCTTGNPYWPGAFVTGGQIICSTPTQPISMVDPLSRTTTTNETCLFFFLAFLTLIPVRSFARIKLGIRKHIHTHTHTSFIYEGVRLCAFDLIKLSHETRASLLGIIFRRVFALIRVLAITSNCGLRRERCIRVCERIIYESPLLIISPLTR